MSKSKGVALLVGAGDAIGAAVARRFAEGGYKVCIARREATKSQALVDELNAVGCYVRAFSTDARDENSVQELFAQVEKDVGPIEVCLFNAGANVGKPLLETTEKLFFRAWQLPVMPGFLLAAKRRVTWSTAVAAQFCSPVPRPACAGAEAAAFAAAKFGLRAVAQAMARELGPKNIHVAHLIMDGPIDSPGECIGASWWTRASTHRRCRRTA